MYSKKTQMLELLRKKYISNKSRIHYKNEINKMQDSKHQFKVILKKFQNKAIVLLYIVFIFRWFLPFKVVTRLNSLN